MINSVTNYSASLIAVSILLFIFTATANAGQNGIIVFSVNKNSVGSIESMKPDGSNRETLASFENSTAHTPEWSPYATHIAFELFHDLRADVYTMKPNGSKLTNLTSLSFPNFARTPDWSPDGTELAYSFQPGSSMTDIYKMNIDGSGETRLTENPAIDGRPSWGLGGWIAFESLRSGNWELWAMTEDGENDTRLTWDTSKDSRYPDISPDGTKIAYTMKNDGCEDLYLLDLLNGETKQLTNTPDRVESEPTWSPSGTKLAFESYLSGGYMDIYVMNVDGSGLSNITGTPDTSEASPDWGSKVQKPPISDPVINPGRYFRSLLDKNARREVNKK